MLQCAAVAVLQNEIAKIVKAGKRNEQKNEKKQSKFR